jgi:serine/threonine-protein kinase
MRFSFTRNVLTAMDSIQKVSAVYNGTDEQNPGQAVPLQSNTASTEDGIVSGSHTVDHSAVAKLQTTSILVKSWPWSKVYLNYQPLDVTPMTAPRNVDPGTYLLSLQNPDFPVWSDSIIIKANKQNEFFFNLDSLFYFLNLEVIPWGEVYIDGKYIGTTPLSQPIHLSRKQHRIEIRNKFYESWSDTLYWSGQDTLKKYVVLVENQKRDKKQQ